MPKGANFGNTIIGISIFVIIVSSIFLAVGQNKMSDAERELRAYYGGYYDTYQKMYYLPGEQMRDNATYGVIFGVCALIWGIIVTAQANKEKGKRSGRTPDLLKAVLSEKDGGHANTYAPTAQPVQEGVWRCSCGQIHSGYVGTCGCGKTKEEGKKVYNTDPPPNSFVSEGGQAQTYGKRPHPYHKLGGWLGFIAYCQIIGIVLLAILSLVGFFALVRTARIYAEYGISSGWVLFLGFVELAGFGIAAILGFKFFSMIRSKDPHFLRFYELIFLVTVGIYAVGWVLGGFAGFGEFFRNVATQAIGFAIWGTYFRKSVRVRTYFGSDEYFRHSIFFRNSVPPLPADGSVGFSPAECEKAKADYLSRMSELAAEADRTSAAAAATVDPKKEEIAYSPKVEDTEFLSLPELDEYKALLDSIAEIEKEFLGYTMFCYKCGDQLREGASFCHKCGTPAVAQTDWSWNG